MHPVGYLLILIGAIIVGAGSAFSIFSQLPDTLTKKIYDNEQISFSPNRGTSSIRCILNLKNDSRVNVQLESKSGPFTFSIDEFVGFPPSTGVDKECITRTKPEFERKGIISTGKEETFEVNLEKGIYSINFISEADYEVNTSLDVMVTQRLKPYQKLLEPGLQLLEVGFPILITGIVLLFGLQT
jgi:hypothetical protein